MNYSRRLIVLLCLLLLLSTRIHAEMDQEAMVIKYVDRGGALDIRNAYKFDLIRKILDITTPEFGPFRLEPYNQDPGAARLSLLISQGDFVNVLWASPGTPIAKANVITIPIDILRGLQGYRICLTNEGTQAVFDKVTDINSINALRIAQRTGWAELEIYAHNKIPLQKSPSFEGLFDMLSNNRFDCLPMAVNEVFAIYHEKHPQMHNLAIDKNLLIFYDYPLYLHVSAKYPELAKRLKTGLEKLYANGEFDRLLSQHFSKDIELLRLRERRKICLTTPYIPDSHFCENTDKLYALKK